MILSLVANKSRVERAELFLRTTAWLLDTSKRILKADTQQQVTTFDKYDKFA